MLSSENRKLYESIMKGIRNNMELNEEVNIIEGKGPKIVKLQKAYGVRPTIMNLFEYCNGIFDRHDQSIFITYVLRFLSHATEDKPICLETDGRLIYNAFMAALKSATTYHTYKVAKRYLNLDSMGKFLWDFKRNYGKIRMTQIWLGGEWKCDRLGKTFSISKIIYKTKDEIETIEESKRKEDERIEDEKEMRANAANVIAGKTTDNNHIASSSSSQAVMQQKGKKNKPAGMAFDSKICKDNCPAAWFTNISNEALYDDSMKTLSKDQCIYKVCRPKAPAGEQAGALDAIPKVYFVEKYIHDTYTKVKVEGTDNEGKTQDKLQMSIRAAYVLDCGWPEDDTDVQSQKHKNRQFDVKLYYVCVMNLKKYLDLYINDPAKLNDPSNEYYIHNDEARNRMREYVEWYKAKFEMDVNESVMARRITNMVMKAVNEQLHNDMHQVTCTIIRAGMETERRTVCRDTYFGCISYIFDGDAGAHGYVINYLESNGMKVCDIIENRRNEDEGYIMLTADCDDEDVCFIFRMK